MHVGGRGDDPLGMHGKGWSALCPAACGGGTAHPCMDPLLIHLCTRRPMCSVIECEFLMALDCLWSWRKRTWADHLKGRIVYGLYTLWPGNKGDPDLDVEVDNDMGLHTTLGLGLRQGPG